MNTAKFLFVCFVITGCAVIKTRMDANVNSMAILEESNILVFIFDPNSKHDALIVQNWMRGYEIILPDYISSNKEQFTGVRTDAEIYNERFFWDPQSTHNTYHITIYLYKPLKPEEYLQGFAFDGNSEDFTFVEMGEAKKLMSREEAIVLDSIPHDFHYMHLYVRAIGKRLSGP